MWYKQDCCHYSNCGFHGCAGEPCRAHTPTAVAGHTCQWTAEITICIEIVMLLERFNTMPIGAHARQAAKAAHKLRGQAPPDAAHAPFCGRDSYYQC